MCFCRSEFCIGKIVFNLMVLIGTVATVLENMLRLLVIFLTVLFTRAASQNSTEAVNIKFLPVGPKFYGLSAELARVEPPNLSLGYAFCLRANIRSWNFNIFIETSLFALQIMAYPNQKGLYKNDDLKYYFKYDDSILAVSLTSWNAFCASFDAVNHSLVVVINGKMVINATTEYDVDDEWTHGALNNLTLQFGGGLFTGQIADVLFWSRPINKSEIEIYANGCQLDFANYSKPEKMVWSEINATVRNIKMDPISKQTFCSKQSKSGVAVIVLAIQAFLDTTVGSAACSQLNGKVIYPKNEEDLKFILASIGEEYLTNNSYSRQYWVPVRRSGNAKTKK